MTNCIVVPVPVNPLHEEIQTAMVTGSKFESAEVGELLYVHTHSGMIFNQAFELDYVITNEKTGPTIECRLFDSNDKEVDRCKKDGSMWQTFELKYLSQTVSFEINPEETV